MLNFMSLCLMKNTVFSRSNDVSSGIDLFSYDDPAASEDYVDNGAFNRT